MIIKKHIRINMIKFNQKSIGYLSIFFLTIIPLFYLPLANNKVVLFTPDDFQINLKTSNGASNYSITQSVTYDVEINLTLTHTSGGPSYDNYYFKIPRLNERSPNSSLSRDCPPFQESDLLYSKVTGADDPPYLEIDEFNNTYEVFNSTTILDSNQVTFDQFYRVTLNEVTFGNLLSLDITMDDYDVNDEIFDLYCNDTEQYYERDNAALITKSNEIAGAFSNPARKAYAIAQWIDTYVEYNDSMPAEEKGALWAFNQNPKSGDCSEFSSLMVTLLRIQGIPARKVTGYLLSSSSNFKPYVGYSRNFTWINNDINLLGHAWVEYYIPGVGWISCEPQVASLYKTSSYYRLTENIGAWFTIPAWNGTHIEYLDLSEYTAKYTSYSLGYDWRYSLNITVIDSNFTPDPDYLGFLINIAIILGVIALVGLVIYIIIKKT